MIKCMRCKTAFPERLICVRWDKDDLGDPIEIREHCPICNSEDLEEIEDNETKPAPAGSGE